MPRKRISKIRLAVTHSDTEASEKLSDAERASNTLHQKSHSCMELISLIAYSPESGWRIWISFEATSP